MDKKKNKQSADSRSVATESTAAGTTPTTPLTADTSDAAEQAYHVPALLHQSIDALDVHPGGIYVDCTLGGAGHTSAIAARLDGRGTVYALDQDAEAIARVSGAGAIPCVTPIRTNFRYIANFMKYCGVYGKVDGVLADLGVSFHHFDDPERGFSFRFPSGRLDMRMNTDSELTAEKFLAETTEDELAEVLRLYGEFGRARQLARAIVNARATQSIATAEQLVAIARRFINPRAEKKELAQVFQALRIRVNDEISALRDMLCGALDTLRPGGRIAIITYHSLEDRLVKNFFRTGNVQGTLVKDFYGRVHAPLRPLTSRPIVPDDAEIAANPRCRSAKLRVAEKLP